MDVVVNLPKDEKCLLILRKNASYIKAMLILKMIESLNVDQNICKQILKKVIIELEKNDK